MIQYGAYDDEEKVLVDRDEFLELIKWGLEAHRALTVLSSLPNPLPRDVKDRLAEMNSHLPKRYQKHFVAYSNKAVLDGLREVFGG